MHSHNKLYPLHGPPDLEEEPETQPTSRAYPAYIKSKMGAEGLEPPTSSV
jgi:hypothetical protein